MDKETHFLLIDDKSEILESLGAVLHLLHFHNVTKCSNLVEALKIHKSKPVEVIFVEVLDDSLFESALDAFKEVSSKTKLIAMSAAATPEMVKLVSKHGIDGFLVEPFNAATVEKVLKRVNKLKAKDAK